MTPGPHVLEFSSIARVFGIVIASIVLVGLIVIPLWKKSVGLGSVVSFTSAKVVLMILLFAFPTASVGTANYFLFEDTKHVDSCGQCHTMRPMVEDMRDPHSQTLAARHYKFHWIQKDNCFQCHTDYGLHGDVQAKMDGLRHLLKYVTRTYDEPLAYRRRPYNNANCLRCHEGVAAWEAVSSHRILRERLQRSETSCTSCHGVPHPPIDRVNVHD